VECDGDDNLRLCGHLDGFTVPDALKRATPWLRRGGRVEIDLSGVTHADSAGVALLLDWQRASRRRGGHVQYRNAPAQLHALIDFCELEGVLPID